MWKSQEDLWSTSVATLSPESVTHLTSSLSSPSLQLGVNRSTWSTGTLNTVASGSWGLSKIGTASAGGSGGAGTSQWSSGASGGSLWSSARSSTESTSPRTNLRISLKARSRTTTDEIELSTLSPSPTASPSSSSASLHHSPTESLQSFKDEVVDDKPRPLGGSLKSYKSEKLRMRKKEKTFPPPSHTSIDDDQQQQQQPQQHQQQEEKEEEGKYSICFCSISTQAFKFNIEKAAEIGCQVIKEFLDTYKDERIKVYLVDLKESETLAKFREKAPRGDNYDNRFFITPANLCYLKTRPEGSIPCWYIVNASNAAFNSGGSGTNKAIHKACKGSAPSLKRLTLQSYKPPAIVGKAYPVDLVPGSFLRDHQNVRTVIHVVGPNMDPKRRNCLDNNYHLGSLLLRKSYESVLQTFIERTGLAISGRIPRSIPELYNSLPLPKWCFLDTDNRWEAYPDVVGEEIERLMKVSQETQKKLVLAPQLLLLIDFESMEVRSIRKYDMAFQRKKIIRGTWFWQEKNGNWIPYSTEIATQLEAALEKDRFRTLSICNDPNQNYIVTQCNDGTFRQFRQTKKCNTKKGGRLVCRGYQGRVLEKKEEPTKNEHLILQDEGLMKYEIACKLFLCAISSDQSDAHFQEAFKHFLSAAKKNEINSILLVAMYYIFGFDVVDINDEEAVSWLVRAAELVPNSDPRYAKFAAIEWKTLIEDPNGQSKEEFFSSFVIDCRRYFE